MKHYLLIYFIVSLCVFGPITASPTSSQTLDNIFVDLHLKNATLEEGLRSISQQTGLTFAYQHDVFNPYRRITLNYNHISVSEVLKLFFNEDLNSGKNLLLRKERSSVVFKFSLPKPKIPTTQNLVPSKLATNSLVPPTKLLNLQQLNESVRGKIIDGVTREPIIGATVQLEGTNYGTFTDDDGNYVLSNVPPGSYKLQINSLGYKAYTQEVTVVSGKTVRADIRMASGEVTLNDVVIEARRVLNTETAILSERKNSAIVQDGISAATIERTASITTAQAMQKITGVSVRDGRYVSVRGMTDRNIVMQLNGARLTSSDPSRSSVPIDLIPAQLLDNISVNKTVLPDRPGDATAAVVELKTKSIPEKLVISATAQAGFNDNIGWTGKYTLFQGGNPGFFGQNIDKLKLSDDFKNISNQYPNGFSDLTVKANLTPEGYAESQRVTNIMHQLAPVASATPQRAPLNQIYAINFGNRYRIGPFKLGVVAGLNYYRRSAQLDGDNSRYRNNPYLITASRVNPTLLYTAREHTGSQSITYGALLGMSLAVNGDNEVSIHFIPSRNIESIASQLDARVNVGTYTPALTNPAVYGLDIPDTSGKATTNLYQLQSTQRDFTTFQFRGEHRFLQLTPDKKAQLSWNLSTSVASQQDPDYRNVDRTALSIQRYFRTTKDNNFNGTVDLTVPLNLSDHQSFIKAGGFTLRRTRNYQERFYNLNGFSRPDPRFPTGTTLLPPDLKIPVTNGDPLATLVSPDNVGYLYNYTTGAAQAVQPGYLYSPLATGNDYNISQYINALYLMADVRLIKQLRVAGGVRVEDTDVLGQRDTTGADVRKIITEKQYRDVFGVDQKEHQWLPSGTIIYNPIANVNVRFSASKTLARPELRELVPIAIFDALQVAYIKGQNKLINAIYQNYDFRVEWFPRPEEVFAVSGFYKKVDNALERTYTFGVTNLIKDGYSVPALTGVLGQVIGTQSFRNNPNSGFLYGTELEARVGMERVSDVLKNLIIGANATFIYSETKITPAELIQLQAYDRNAQSKRPLFEQPSYIVNGNMTYSDPKRGTNFTAYFNWVGQRLVEVNSDGTPNVYEKPPRQLDLIASQEFFKKHFVAKCFVKNVLNDPTEWIYKTPGNTNNYGSNQLQYNRRLYKTGREISLGLTYIF